MYKFTQTYTINKKPVYNITTTANKIKLDSKEPVEVNEPENDKSDKTPHTHYETKKKTSKVKYKCSRDDDYIEVPGGTESVTYTDDEGNSYEVDVGDLIDYDGDDGEIEYTKGKNKNNRMKLSSKVHSQKMLFLSQQFMNNRIYC